MNIRLETITAMLPSASERTVPSRATARPPTSTPTMDAMSPNSLATAAISFSV